MSDTGGFPLINSLGTDQSPSLSPEQERSLEINIDSGVKDRLAESRGSYPSTRQQTQSEILSLEVLHRSLGGNPFAVKRLPFSVMRDMLLDPDIAFANYYIKNPLISAPFAIESEDAQLAAAIDAILRPVNADLIEKFYGATGTGYQPLVKRFKLEKLEAKYRDKNSDEPEKDRDVWNSKNVDALVLDKFVALAPENCIPIWDETGGFNGFVYSLVPLPNPQLVGIANVYGPPALSGFPIGLDHAMWIVNESAENYGSLYGSPRTKRAYRFWWSFWYRWALADRAYERKADPALAVWYPTDVAEGIDPNDPNSEAPTVRSLQEKALQLGRNIRSGTVVAFPGEFMTGEDGKTMNQRKWEAKYIEGGENFSLLDQNFQLLSNMKTKCVTADTPIDCPRDHKRFPYGVPISMLKRGDIIWTFNTQTLKFELNKIKDSICTGKEETIYRVNLSNGKYIRATSTHPFFTTNLEWKNVDKLEDGDKLVKFSRDCEPFVKLDPTTFGHPKNIEYVEVAKFDGKKEKGFHIHHKDGMHYNNSTHNLEKLSQSDHMALERTGRRVIRFSREKISKTRSRLLDERRHIKIKELHKDDDLLLKIRKEKLSLYEPCFFDGCDNKKIYARGVCLKHYEHFRYYNKLDSLPDYKSTLIFNIKSCACGRYFAPTSSRQYRCQACRYGKYIENNRKAKIKNDFSGAPTFEEISDYVTVVSVEECGKEDVWDISVDGSEFCRNFISNEVILHNSMFLPTQAFVDATVSGQDSSQRYIGAQMGQIYQESQGLASEQYDDYVNKDIIPQLVAANFPDKIKVPVRKVTRGYATKDSETTKQLLTLLFQKNPEEMPINKRQFLNELGLPLNTEDQQKDIEKKKEEAIKSQPEIMEPSKKEGTAGYNAGVEKTQTGEHIYYNGPGQINLSVTNPGFIDSLPDIPPYKDPVVRSVALKMRKIIHDRYQNQISSFSKQIKDGTVIKLAEEKKEKSKPGFAAGAAKIAAAGAAATWLSQQATDFPAVLAQVREFLSRIVGTAGTKELKLANLDPEVFNPSSADKWVNTYAEQSLKFMDQTVRDQMREFLEQKLQQNSDPDFISKEIEDYFSELPDIHAARAVRAQTRDAYNTGMLQAAHEAGIDQVMAHDASDGTNPKTDTKCILRDGKVFSPKEAMKETEHPNGTLWFSYLNTQNLSVQVTDDIPDHLELSDRHPAVYDDKTETLYIRERAKDSQSIYSLALSEKLRIR